MFPSFLKNTSLLLLFSLQALAVWAQITPLRFHRLTTEDNLSSQDYNLYMYKDQRSFVWISSVTALNRFDGEEIIQYHHDAKDTSSLADENIHSQFFEDQDSNLWFSTNHAIHRYHFEY